MTTVGIEEVAVCADVEVKPDADIERVQAEIWFPIEQYFNPPIRFHTLQEERDAGRAVEDIFNGPELNNGFIEADDLQAAALEAHLRGLRHLDRLMDIRRRDRGQPAAAHQIRFRGQRHQGRCRPHLGERRSPSSMPARSAPRGCCSSAPGISRGSTSTCRGSSSIKTACLSCRGWTKRPIR